MPAVLINKNTGEHVKAKTLANQLQLRTQQATGGSASAMVEPEVLLASQGDDLELSYSIRNKGKVRGRCRVALYCNDRLVHIVAHDIDAQSTFNGKIPYKVIFPDRQVLKLVIIDDASDRELWSEVVTVEVINKAEFVAE